MSTYRELQEQIDQLRAQAEEVRMIELAGVIMEIKTKMQEYGITGADLGLMGKKRVMKPMPAAMEPIASSAPVESEATAVEEEKL